MIESGILTKIISAYQIAEATHGEFFSCKKDGFMCISEEVGELAQAIMDKHSDKKQEAELIDIIVSCCRLHEKHYS